MYKMCKAEYVIMNEAVLITCGKIERLWSSFVQMTLHFMELRPHQNYNIHC